MKIILYAALVVLIGYFVLIIIPDKEIVNDPKINIYYKTSDTSRTYIEEEVRLMDVEHTNIYLDVSWRYTLESYLDLPSIPKLEVSEGGIGYEIYKDDNLIQSENMLSEEFKKVSHLKYATTFKIRVDMSSILNKTFDITSKGTYKIVVKYNVLINGQPKEFNNQTEFKVI